MAAALSWPTLSVAGVVLLLVMVPTPESGPLNLLHFREAIREGHDVARNAGSSLFQRSFDRLGEDIAVKVKVAR